MLRNASILAANLDKTTYEPRSILRPYPFYLPNPYFWKRPFQLEFSKSRTSRLLLVAETRLEYAEKSTQFGNFLSVCPEGHDFLEVVEFVHVPSLRYRCREQSIKGIV